MAISKLAVVAIGTLAAACVDGLGEDDATQALAPAPYFPGDTANVAEFAVDVSVWEQPIAQSQMDCFWDSGVRHVVVGTQDRIVARQQLQMAVDRGMTVDAYVYIYWDRDIDAQIAAAFAMVQGFPISRMWLDIEEPTSLGANTLVPRIQHGLATCSTQATCGIYTSPGWWKTYINNTTAFAATPLWYALYNKKRSLSDWSVEQFGGWATPVAKQFQTAPLCAAGGADWDIMQVAGTPAVTVDRTLPPDSQAAPAAPTGLWPTGGMVIPIDYVKIMSGTLPRATSYQLALEQYTGTAWAAYYTWTNANAFQKVSPPARPALFRVRARAQNAHGWGAWSDYATFDYGTYTGPRPGSSPTPPPPATGTTPGSLAPDGTTVTTSTVTMTCSTVTTATSYQFAVEIASAGAWTSYYTYTSATAAKAFSPQTRGVDYRFRVRALVAGVYGDWSTYATFHVQ